MAEDKTAVKIWKKTFGEEPTQIIPSTSKLNDEWKAMGEAYGYMQLEKQRYKKAGLVEAVKQIDEKVSQKQKELEGRTMDLMGYPRLSSMIKGTLIEQARADNLFLNVYKLEEYTKVPPIHIAQAIMEARQYFDRIEVWAIEDKEYVRPYKDPAVIGYVKVGYQEIPYLIATWGEDITPEDLGLARLLENK